jgi:aspartate/glutamate racemase
LEGGYAIYGVDIGIIVLETYFPRLIGDMGYATTFNFPVAYRTVSGALPRKVVNGDYSLLDNFITKARELEDMGVKAITTNCGYLARFQQELTCAVSIPVFTSSLIQVPLVSRMLSKDKKVGIIVADAKNIDDDVFKKVGWSSKDIDVVVCGMESSPEFVRVVLENARDANFTLLREEVYEVCCGLYKKCSELGAIVFECTDLPPYAQYIKKRLKLPVFDIVTLTKMVYEAVHIREE